jgi:membrane protease YdiL (CAAX protease family)
MTASPLVQSSSWWSGLLTLRWKPSKDLAAVAMSWLLVVAALYTATIIVGPTAAGGLAYFGLYAILGATLFGIGIPLYWTVAVRKRPISDLGITTKLIWVSLGLQVAFAVLQYFGAYRNITVPQLASLLPLGALALTIGFFEAIFWRGWVLSRLEDAFGLLPAIVVGSALYAAYHIGYGMPLSEITFLFFIGLMYAVAFRLTRSIFILWPIFQPSGQLVTLLRDGLALPPLAALGFFEVLIVMWVLIWLAARAYKKAVQNKAAA